MWNLLYTIKIFLNIPKDENRTIVDLGKNYKCHLFLNSNGNIRLLAMTLELTNLGVDSNGVIDLDKGKWHTFKHILHHLRTIH